MEYKKQRNCKFCNKIFTAYNWRAEVCSHECHLERRRIWHKKNGDKVRSKERERYHNGGKEYYAKYEKTPKGFLMRKYRNMQSRILGIQKLKAHLYKGKSLLGRDKFYEWSFASKEFWKLYNVWIKSGHNCKLTPTVDRIDSSKGYFLDNMEWVTHSENSRRSSITRYQMKI